MCNNLSYIYPYLWQISLVCFCCISLQHVYWARMRSHYWLSRYQSSSFHRWHCIHSKQTFHSGKLSHQNIPNKFSIHNIFTKICYCNFQLKLCPRPSIVHRKIVRLSTVHRKDNSPKIDTNLTFFDLRIFSRNFLCLLSQV